MPCSEIDDRATLRLERAQLLVKSCLTLAEERDLPRSFVCRRAGPRVFPLEPLPLDEGALALQTEDLCSHACVREIIDGSTRGSIKGRVQVTDCVVQERGDLRRDSGREATAWIIGEASVQVRAERRDSLLVGIGNRRTVLDEESNP